MFPSIHEIAEGLDQKSLTCELPINVDGTLVYVHPLLAYAGEMAFVLSLPAGAAFSLTWHGFDEEHLILTGAGVFVNGGRAIRFRPACHEVMPAGTLHGFREVSAAARILTHIKHKRRERRLTPLAA
jgi:hypothetical protein